MTIFHLHMQELLATDLDYTTAADTLQLVNVNIHCRSYRNGLLEHEKWETTGAHNLCLFTDHNSWLRYALMMQ